MDSNLNVLEAKVLEAVELIKELRGENRRLKSIPGFAHAVDPAGDLAKLVVDRVV